jgi:hypothetical protein
MEKKTKIILAVGIIIVVSIMAMVFIFLQEGTYVYTNEEAGFKLTLPKNWELKGEFETGSWFSYQFENENYYLSMHVQIEPGYFEKNMSDIINNTTELFSNTTNTNFTIESYNQITINGMDACQFNITGKYENSEYPTKSKWVKGFNNEKYFEILCEGTPSFLFDEHADEIEQIINSFVIL